MSQETPAQLFRRKAQEYIDKKRLLEQIVETAQPIEGGYLIPAELINQLRDNVQSARAQVKSEERSP